MTTCVRKKSVYRGCFYASPVMQMLYGENNSKIIRSLFCKCRGRLSRKCYPPPVLQISLGFRNIRA